MYKGPRLVLLHTLVKEAFSRLVFEITRQGLFFQTCHEFSDKVDFDENHERGKTHNETSMIFSNTNTVSRILGACD